MTAFFLYFETRNASSTHYEGFAEVGRFVVPGRLDSGRMPLSVNGRQVVASMLSDGSNHGIADYFIGSDKQAIRESLFGFMQARLSNDAIVAHLMRFIYDNQKALTVDTANAVDLSLADFKARFGQALFEPHGLLRVTPGGLNAD